jgi:membrane protein implicated in regulation of membrane protease activity
MTAESEVTANLNVERPFVGTLLLFVGLLACCFIPLLVLGGGLAIVSFLAQKNNWLALVTFLVLAFALFGIYFRSKRNTRHGTAGYGKAGCN